MAQLCGPRRSFVRHTEFHHDVAPIRIRRYISSAHNSRSDRTNSACSTADGRSGGAGIRCADSRRQFGHDERHYAQWNDSVSAGKRAFCRLLATSRPTGAGRRSDHTIERRPYHVTSNDCDTVTLTSWILDFRWTQRTAVDYSDSGQLTTSRHLIFMRPVPLTMRAFPESPASPELEGASMPDPAAADWILAAIDGTLSETYQTATNQSSVLRFYNDFRSSDRMKLYREGPGVSGGDVRLPVTPVIPASLGLRVATELACSVQAVRDVACRGVGEIAESSYRWLRRVIEGNPEAKICIVGHSRGGTIATQLAIRLDQLNVPVEFLGLYDAVDMAIGFDASYIPSNVRHAAHAKRDPSLRSRDGWGNSSRPSASSHQERSFVATHGSVGGAAPADCSVRSPDIGNRVVRSGFTADDHCAFPLTAGANHGNGMAADAWIRQQARAAGVPV